MVKSCDEILARIDEYSLIHWILMVINYNILIYNGLNTFPLYFAVLHIRKTTAHIFKTAAHISITAQRISKTVAAGRITATHIEKTTLYGCITAM
jgi:hypothetical protein